MRRITVNTGRTYEITVGRGLERELENGLTRLIARPAKVAVITDDQVDARYSKRLTGVIEQSGYMVCKFVFPAGETSKNLETLTQVFAFLAQNEITRTDLIVALGGGVVGDLAGFAAASWLRGIRFVQIPTTLLAMVDSSVGGKTGVDINEGKNLVGAFWQPSAVFCDLSFLETLSPEQFANGVAEIIKYGAILDESLLCLLEQGQLKERMEEIVCRCIDLKRMVVERDERDTGERQWLNFGHTLGHAIEKESGFSVFHGQGVAIGMVMMARACERRGITPPGVAERLQACCTQYHLPVCCDYPIKALCVHCAGDKKRTGKKISLVTLSRIGEATLTPVDAQQLEHFFGEQEYE